MRPVNYEIELIQYLPEKTRDNRIIKEFLYTSAIYLMSLDRSVFNKKKSYIIKNINND